MSWGHYHWTRLDFAARGGYSYKVFRPNGSGSLYRRLFGHGWFETDWIAPVPPEAYDVSVAQLSEVRVFAVSGREWRGVRGIKP